MNNDLSTLGFVLLMAIVIAIFVSCGGSVTATDPFEYTDVPFETQIEGNIDGLDFCADMKSFLPKDIGSRQITLSFTSPPSLRGMVVDIIDEKITARIGNSIIKDWQADDIPLYIDALCNRQSIESVHNSSSESFTVTVSNGNCNLEYLFDRSSRLPIKISGNNERHSFSINILKFKSLN